MKINLQEFTWLVDNKLPPGLTFEGVYQAFEGDIRVIAKDKGGREYRLTINKTPEEGLLTLELM